MKRINMNKMAKLVSVGEAGKKEVNIAQIKETIKVFLEELALFDDKDIIELIKRYR